MQKTPFMLLALMAALALALASGCQPEDEPTPTTPELTANALVQQYLNIDLDAPPNYAAPAYPVHYDANVRATDNAPSLNPVTNKGALLGRVIFYDRMMSLNNSVACASCHLQNKGFTDDKALSEGFMGGLTGQHAMRLANTNFYVGEVMFWNKRARDLEQQSTMPIKDHTEMGFDASAGGIDSLIRKMKRLNYYPALFEYAFGNSDITEERIQRALAQFVRSMVSTGSKFDQGFAQVFNTGLPGAGIAQPFPNFTAQENIGKQLFLLPPNQGGAACAGCHAPPTFALAPNSLSNGLDAGETVIFKSPSLKNVAVAGPYMHDGRLATLQQVVEHYNSGIQTGAALDNRLRAPNGQPLRLNLSQQQKDALVAFLQTLTDNNLLTDPKFSDPFK